MKLEEERNRSKFRSILRSNITSDNSIAKQGHNIGNSLIGDCGDHGKVQLRMT